VKTYALTLPFEVGKTLRIMGNYGPIDVELIGYVLTTHGLSFVVMKFDGSKGGFSMYVQADQILSDRDVLDGYEFVGLAGANTFV
jgi:hypothetical protein